MDLGKTRRLADLGRAHLDYQRKFTPAMEDYLEVIFELIKVKGYARVVEISNHLNVKSSTVTGMIKRLDKKRLLIHERYRGITLTKKGEVLAKSITERHGILVEFLRLLGVEETTAHKNVEGIEHYLDTVAVMRLASMVKLFREKPEWYQEYRKYSDSAMS